MDFYAEDFESFENVSYIAIVGPFDPDFADELLTRAKRIQEASPNKDTLALDVRGLTGLEAEHYEVLKDIQDRLNEMDWDLYFCNIPTRFRDFFHSGRVQRDFEVFETKSDLVEFLGEDEEAEQQEEPTSNFEPVPVILRTSSGVRLLEGVANDLADTVLTVWTSDHNTKTIDGNDNLDCNLYFDTDRIQVVPRSISIVDIDEVDDENWNYRLTIDLKNIDELELEQIKEYFGSATASG